MGFMGMSQKQLREYQPFDRKLNFIPFSEPSKCYIVPPQVAVRAHLFGFLSSVC